MNFHVNSQNFDIRIFLSDGLFDNFWCIGVRVGSVRHVMCRCAFSTLLFWSWLMSLSFWAKVSIIGVSAKNYLDIFVKFLLWKPKVYFQYFQYHIANLEQNWKFVWIIAHKCNKMLQLEYSFKIEYKFNKMLQLKYPNEEIYCVIAQKLLCATRNKNPFNYCAILMKRGI